MAYAKQQRKKGTLTKDEIVQCAFNLIANKGTEGCSMRALGNEVGHGLGVSGSAPIYNCDFAHGVSFWLRVLVFYASLKAFSLGLDGASNRERSPERAWSRPMAKHGVYIAARAISNMLTAVLLRTSARASRGAPCA